MTREYVVCYAFRSRRAPLGPLGPEETTVHVGRPGFFSLGYTLCRRKVSRRISTSPSEATCRESKRRWELATGLRTTSTPRRSSGRSRWYLRRGSPRHLH